MIVFFIKKKKSISNLSEKSVLLLKYNLHEFYIFYAKNVLEFFTLFLKNLAVYVYINLSTYLHLLIKCIIIKMKVRWYLRN